MSKSFSTRDLYDLISVNARISTKTAEKVWKKILDIIISELQYNDKISIDNFGKFDKIYEGGKDEYITNELGIVTQRYVPPIMSIKFTPSTNFLKRLNDDILEQMGKVHENDLFFEYGNVIVDKNIEDDLNKQIRKALDRKKKRREKEKNRENNLYIPQRNGEIPKSGKDIFKGQPIKCTTINKSFSSISKCAKDLDLRPNNIINVLDTDEDLFGYRFIRLTTEEYEKEQEKIQQMKESNNET